MSMIASRVVRTATGVLGALVLIGGLGCFLVNRGVDEHYSSSWRSASTENAQYRQVYVSSPVVIPSVLQVNDSIALAVTDAWVERPTHVEYRWVFFRREVQDSSFRLVIHLAQTVPPTAPWTHRLGRSFAGAEILVDGERPERTGNAYVQAVLRTSDHAFADTVRLSLERR